jgi:hypothetical protein
MTPQLSWPWLPPFMERQLHQTPTIGVRQYQAFAIASAMRG